MKFDMGDAFAVSGLLLLSAGLWLWLPPVSLIVTGAILLAIGLTAGLRNR